MGWGTRNGRRQNKQEQRQQGQNYARSANAEWHGETGPSDSKRQSLQEPRTNTSETWHLYLLNGEENNNEYVWVTCGACTHRRDVKPPAEVWPAVNKHRNAFHFSRLPRTAAVMEGVPSCLRVCFSVTSHGEGKRFSPHGEGKRSAKLLYVGVSKKTESIHKLERGRCFLLAKFQFSRHGRPNVSGDHQR